MEVHRLHLTDDGVRTIVRCQAARDVASYAASTLGDDGWDQRVGAASLRKLHALNPERVLLSHDADEFRA